MLKIKLDSRLLSSPLGEQPAGINCYAEGAREYELFPPISSVVHEAMWPASSHPRSKIAA